MVKGSVKVTSTSKMDDIKKRINELVKKDVLVGIPEENTSRGEQDSINNAELLYAHTHGIRKKAMRQEMQENINKGMKYSEAHSLYIQTHGSPLLAVPPRPVIEPAIEDSKEYIAAKLADVSKAALDGNSGKLEGELHQVGMLGQNVARSWFENPKNNWPPNSEQTIKLKKSNLPLIDSGQLRKSITYVVRDKE